jgi:hypothetical protein
MPGTMHHRGLRNRSRVVAWLFCWAVTSTSLGCGGGGPTETDSEAGRYVLQSVNGASLPATFPGTPLGTIVVDSGSVTLVAGGARTYTAEVFTTVDGQGGIGSDAGTYARTENVVTFTSTANPPLSYDGTLTGDELSIRLPGAAIGVPGITVTLVGRK